ncbi:histidine phosphatase family protein [Actinokineospora iranica]|uniref:Broad specificity phosphatase PhoE n=1 Tax=Actinokineospora iranica TaxID=1271860 RepID=A0A1G6VBS5_9PSEU|nr:histidine phosphatase family protein [Actinokineospora iranica]SDD51038.1 Broad specificity phosphatase PhoE [Actinokineospora iranica]
MSAVYLLRHGQASFGAADYDVLSPTGELQAKVLGAELRERGLAPAQAWSGTLSRQRSTASITLAAAGIDLPCQTDERWNEYDHLGLVQHHLAAHETKQPASSRDFQDILDRALHGWISDGVPAGQAGTFADFEGRANAALTEVAESLGSGGTAVVFTSGGVIAAICARLLGMPGAGLVSLNRVVVNAAVTKIVHGRSGASLVSFNEHGHFEGANRELLTYR